MLQPRSTFDFGPSPHSSSTGFVSNNKPAYANDMFTGSTGPSLLPSHKSTGHLSGPGSQQLQAQSLQTQPPQSNFHPTSQAQYMNGLHQQQLMQSQTAFGPHLPSSTSAPITTQGGTSHTNGSTQAPSQEEISTIFVVGFPEDMQEREFQNMFTFSPGFEAATLKIPNKELTAYGPGQGGNAGRPGAGYPHTHGGPNDPYNVVTINQGGIVVDGGRDGTTSSWPPSDDQHYAHLVPNGPASGSNAANASISTRKQIIGFAKFRTRAEAIEARDMLQGRRIDIEKGAVLKAEMAKKNLHTKRGIGPLPLQLSSMIGSGGTVAPDALTGMPGMNLHGLTSPQTLGAGVETMTARERELGTLGAMGFTGRRESRLDPREEDADTRNGALVGFGTTRGARERAAEEEDRKWKDKADAERERSAQLRSNNAHAFAAFHSVPSSQQSVGNSLLAATAGESASTIRGDGNGSRVAAANGPWGVESRGNNFPGSLSKLPLYVGLPPRPVSPSQPNDPYGSTPRLWRSSDGTVYLAHVGPPPPITPAKPPHLRHVHPSLPSRPPPYTPAATGHDTSSSSSSSVEGSQDSVDEDTSRAMNILAVNTSEPPLTHETGSSSPQLPSPASGASSGSKSAAVDQNPPINTLYVGNLPSSPPPPGLAPTYLEDSLRDLFHRRPGFRKLCFRQKSNGPMCFVEFADVNYATKALNDLYGATLGGLVKGGGIRLSYSKNPLGVRTPTNATGSSTSQQNGLPASGGATIPVEAFQPKLTELDTGIHPRVDTSGITSPSSSSSSSAYHFSVSPPPPRFVSPPPAYPRAASGQGFGYPPPSNMTTTNSSTPTFSPFGISPSPIGSSIHNNPIPESMNFINSSNGNHLMSTFSDITEHPPTHSPSLDGH